MANKRRRFIAVLILGQVEESETEPKPASLPDSSGLGRPARVSSDAYRSGFDKTFVKISPKYLN